MHSRPPKSGRITFAVVSKCGVRRSSLHVASEWLLVGMLHTAATMGIESLDNYINFSDCTVLTTLERAAIER